MLVTAKRGKLQDLTNLETLPEFEISAGGQYGYYGRGGWGSPSKGAPVDKDGNPIYHSLPESWNTAKSDGERWRWAMAQVVKHKADRRSQMDLEWAGFLQSQFGVGAGAIGGPPVIPLAAEAADGEKPADADVWAAHKLPDTATIAKLTTGVKRFNLPDEFNHIVILKAVIARAGSEQRQALESLIGERMNRHQYPQAAELLRDSEEACNAPATTKMNVQTRIDQIVKNWMQIESTSMQPAGSGAKFDIRYRNGNKATFEARPIKDRRTAHRRPQVHRKQATATRTVQSFRSTTSAGC